MCPLPCLIISGRKAFIVQKWARVLTANVLANDSQVRSDASRYFATYCWTSAGLKSRSVLPCTTPALLMSTVGAPMDERMEDAAEVMDAGEERSQWKKRTEGGAGRC